MSYNDYILILPTKSSVICKKMRGESNTFERKYVKCEVLGGKVGLI